MCDSYIPPFFECVCVGKTGDTVRLCVLALVMLKHGFFQQFRENAPGQNW